ncbi:MULTISPECIES: MaoC family dehydratase [Aliivibrio]|uniref:Dehydratase n=2 Tax=Aliivibrio logei TaxID=688 RepID=A0A1B9NW85_ALILO|nr:MULTISPECIES: MaoC family dehydratase [Aliivibrio]MBB1315093.1 MaoC family dehydratase [Aliivibrio sp. SR45-2]OCH19478.1 dehydratase [Aliivibrio logei]OEF12786.1 dehydratase [Aliivibrio logei 5S-186]
MKVVDFLKHKREYLAKHPFELKDWMSPTIKDYWIEFLQKANNIHIISWVKEHKRTVNCTQEAVQPEPVEMNAETQTLYEELTAQLGDEIHVGSWSVMDQERINNFGAVTEDPQWIHTDPERAAAESPFKTTIAHGFLTLSMLSKMTDNVGNDNLLFPTAKMTVNYGLNKVRFPYPVKAGKRIRSRSTLLSVTPIKRGLEIETEVKVEIEKCRRPGCVAVSVIRLYF